MKRFARSERVSEELRKELSHIIQQELKDPRIASFVSVVRVEATKDLKNAPVHISVYGTDEEKESTIDALKGGASYIRKVLSSRMRMRATPELRFVLDDSMEYSEKIQRILKEVAPPQDDQSEPEAL